MVASIGMVGRVDYNGKRKEENGEERTATGLYSPFSSVTIILFRIILKDVNHMSAGSEFPLQQLEDPSYAERAIAATFGGRMLAYQPVGWGFYGVVYRAEIDRAPGQVIL